MEEASQTGDGTLQGKAQGNRVLEDWPHGTSAQRVRWFRRSLQSGDLNQCQLPAERTQAELSMTNLSRAMRRLRPVTVRHSLLKLNCRNLL